MKKLIFLSVMVLIAAAGCKEKKTADYTRIGDLTQIGPWQEKLNGKVESIIEKLYWAVPESDTFIKGARATKHEIDSLGFTYDFKTVYDINGDLVSYVTMDENDQPIYRWDLSKVDNILARAEYRSGDALKEYAKIKCDDKGIPVLYEFFDPGSDTLISKVEFEDRDFRDTVHVRYYNRKGELTQYQVEVYNDLGLLTDSWVYAPDGSLLDSIIFKYNDRGFVSQISYPDKNKNMIIGDYLKYEYDDMGNWVRMVYSDTTNNAVITERVYTYFK
jgi:hypothetical protein